MNSIFQAFKIDKNDWKPLLAAALVGILAYSIFIFHHLLHNHSPFLPWIPIGEQMISGRWLNRLFFWMNYEADIPVFGPLLGLAFAVLSSYYAVKLLFPFTKKVSIFITIAIIVCYPAVLSPFYYTWTTPVSFISWIFAISAVIFVRERGLLSFVAGVISLTLLLTTNQGALSIFAAFFIASCIAMVVVSAVTKMEEDSQVVSKLIGVSTRLFVMLIATGLIYFLQAIFTGSGVKHGNNEILSLNSLPQVWPQVIVASFKQIIVTQPDILNPVKNILLIVVIVSFLVSLYVCRKRFISLATLIFLWPLMLCSVKVVYFLVKVDFSLYEYRINLGLGFVYSFCFALILYVVNTKRILHIVTIVAAFFILIRFVQADLVRQSVLMYGQMHDLALANRILMRIESLPNLEVGKTYKLVQIGYYPWYRANIHTPLNNRSADTYGEWHMDTGYIVAPNLAPHKVYTLLGSKINMTFDWNTNHESQRHAKEHLLHDRKPYPDQSSVFVINDTIYVYLNEHEIKFNYYFIKY
jgi:hypothetical protein